MYSTRKRNVVVPYEPSKFVIELVETLDRVGVDSNEDVVAAIEAREKEKTLDFNRYGAIFWEVFVAGGQVAPGGQMAEEDPKYHTKRSVFTCDGEASVLSYRDTALLLLQRKPHMRPKLEDVFSSLVQFLDSYDENARANLAYFIASYMAKVPACPATFVVTLSKTDPLVNNGAALSFATRTLAALLKLSDIDRIKAGLKGAKALDTLEVLMPLRDRSPTALGDHFTAAELPSLAAMVRARNLDEVMQEAQDKVVALMEEEASLADMLKTLKACQAASDLNDQQCATIAYNSIGGGVTWSKKTAQHPQQILRALGTYAGLIEPFCQTLRTELEVMTLVQSQCYENYSLLKTFVNMIQLLYQADVVSEDAVRAWFKGGNHVMQRGRQEFVNQMTPFIKWLDEAEEDSDDDDEDESS